MFGKTCLLPQAGLLLESIAGLTQLHCPLIGGPASVQSCHATGNPDSLNSCCFNNPGGQLLLTQFWDTAPSVGPADSWTLHGLWPDNCDGTYEQHCAPEREFTNITAVLAAAAPCTLKYMQTYWKDYQGDDESFWEHEYNKHGTCISTLDPKCYRNHKPGDEVVDYFVRAVQLFKTLPSYDWLAQAGITPSNTKTYTRAEVQAALKKHHAGHDVIINCNKKKELNELWYHYNAFGSVINGRFVPVDPVGPPSTCPETGIKYLPKYDTSAPPPATTTTATTTAGSTAPTATTSAAPAPTGPAALSGKGYLYASTGDSTAAAGFLISSGKWYNTNGTPATFTATPDDSGSSKGLTFTLSSSKGKCAIAAADASLLCAAEVATASSFGWDGSALTYEGKPAFYADGVPSGQAQGTVYAVEKAVGVRFRWAPR